MPTTSAAALAAVVERHRDLAAVPGDLDDVVVGEDLAVGVEDDARAGAGALLALDVELHDRRQHAVGDCSSRRGGGVGRSRRCDRWVTAVDECRRRRPKAVSAARRPAARPRRAAVEHQAARSAAPLGSWTRDGQRSVPPTGAAARRRAGSVTDAQHPPCAQLCTRTQPRSAVGATAVSGSSARRRDEVESAVAGVDLLRAGRSSAPCPGPARATGRASPACGRSRTAR